MEKFREIVSGIFKIPLQEVRDDLTPQNIPDWDSMNYLMLIAELEKYFQIRFTVDEVSNAKCLGDIHKVVKERGKTT